MSNRFTSGQLALLDASIAARRRTVAQRIAAHRAGRSRAEQARDVLQQDGDDAPQRSADREVDLALTDAEVVELQVLERASERLRSPEFGRCADCGGDIAFDRLKVQPVAERCIECEAQAERQAGLSRAPSL